MIQGTHNYRPWNFDFQGWKAAVIIGAPAAGHYAQVLTHELGHVLYLDHTCNEHSIMHPGRPGSGCATTYAPSGVIPADYLPIRLTLGRE